MMNNPYVSQAIAHQRIADMLDDGARSRVAAPARLAAAPVPASRVRGWRGQLTPTILALQRLPALRRRAPRSVHAQCTLRSTVELAPAGCVPVAGSQSR
jgi:hypothetical protein